MELQQPSMSLTEHFPLGCAAQWAAPEHQTIPSDLHSWLTETGSLTQRLIRRFGDCEVVVIGQGRAPLSEDEQIVFAGHAEVEVREVLLVAGGRARVFARSCYVADSHRPLTEQLRQLGRQPLGELLFQADGAKRTTLSVAQMRLSAGLAALASVDPHYGETPLWARCACYQMADAQPLLVKELFLPACLESAHD